MPHVLHSLLHEQRRRLAQQVTSQLVATNFPHYRQLGAPLVKERVSVLLDALLRAISGTPGAFHRHVEEITEERIFEGYFLEEIQTALSLLEEAIWLEVVDRLPAEDHAEHLAKITGIIGSAKDALPRAYLRHFRRAMARATMLEAQLELLSQGTDCPPIADFETGPVIRS